MTFVSIDWSELDGFVDGLGGLNDAVVDEIVHETAAKTIQQVRRVALQKVHTGRYALDGSIYTGGELKKSIQTEQSSFTDVEGDTKVEYGLVTGVRHAIPEEYGVGPLGDPEVAHTPKMRWRVVWQGDDGERHGAYAHSRPAHPYLRPAMSTAGPYAQRFLKLAIEKRFKELEP